MSLADMPRWEDADEWLYEERTASRARCDVCGERPASLAVDGAWLCPVCDAALELAELAGEDRAA